MFGNLGGLGRGEPLPSRQDHQRHASRVGGGAGRQRARLVGRFHVEKLIRHLIARQEVANSMAPSRPAIADHADASVPRAKRRTPLVEHVVEHGIEPFFGRIPWLQQVVIHLRLVDGANGGLGVRVRGEQRPLALRVKLHGLRQEGRPIHLGHALVGEDERNGIPALLQLTKYVEGRDPRVGTQDAVVPTVVLAQISDDRAQNGRVVVNGEQNGLGHGSGAHGRYHTR